MSATEPAATEASAGSVPPLLDSQSSLDGVAQSVDSASDVNQTALEHQRRVEREELISDILRLRWLSVVGALVWLAFAVDDWMIARFIHPIDLRYFWSVRLGALFVSPHILAQFHDPRARVTFLRHLFILGSSIGVCVWGGHGNWALRRQLFEARNIGRYRLKRRIGRGGMGEVWVANHTGLHRDVALKVLRPDDDSDPVAVQRFEQEVAATCRLTHPNTVRVFDYGVTDDGIWYYAMELLEGVTLHELVRASGPLSVDLALTIVHQIARALAEAHARGIVHRDIKPENIFVTRAGDEPDFVKVLDFGIAKMKGETQRVTLTRTGAVFGTPAYMSPEAARSQIASPRSDVYSVGAVLYFILAGHPPFVAPNPAEVLLAHVNQPVVPLDSLADVSVPHELSALALRCLEKDPSRRFPDAGELAAELSRLIARQPPALVDSAC